MKRTLDIEAIVITIFAIIVFILLIIEKQANGL